MKMTEEEALEQFNANPFTLKGIGEERAFLHGFRARSAEIEALREIINNVKER